jgi:hypothetical protein
VASAEDVGKGQKKVGEEKVERKKWKREFKKMRMKLKEKKEIPGNLPKRLSLPTRCCQMENQKQTLPNI